MSLDLQLQRIGPGCCLYCWGFDPGSFKLWLYGKAEVGVGAGHHMSNCCWSEFGCQLDYSCYGHFQDTCSIVLHWVARLMTFHYWWFVSMIPEKCCFEGQQGADRFTFKQIVSGYSFRF